MSSDQNLCIPEYDIIRKAFCTDPFNQIKEEIKYIRDPVQREIRMNKQNIRWYNEVYCCGFAKFCKKTKIQLILEEEYLCRNIKFFSMLKIPEIIKRIYPQYIEDIFTSI